LEPTKPPIQCKPETLSVRVKWPRCEMHHSSPSSVKVKNKWNYTSTPSIAFVVWAKTTSHFLNYGNTVLNTEFRTWQIFCCLQTYMKYLCWTDEVCIVMHSHLGTVYKICQVISTDMKWYLITKNVLLVITVSVYGTEN
jgi:hypothetical protein